MAIIVGVQFQKNGKIHNYDTNGIDCKPDDYVVADTPHGADLGQVVVGNRTVDKDDNCTMRKIIRIATEKDLQNSTENRRKEKEAFEICQQKIAEHQLDMKLVSVEYAFDNSKALFYFTANGRVDFRSLVKDLASAFKMRIELRQIGVRDEARMIGGLGPCGRQICCGAFLDEFQPVSIKMAKEQNLSLNPTKISGVCGRLMCCLKYEQDHYEQTRKMMPRVGKEVITPDGTGNVTDLNIVKETVFVRIVNGDTSEIKEYPLDKIEKSGQNMPQQTTERRVQYSEKAADLNAVEATDSEDTEKRSQGEKTENESKKNEEERETRENKNRRNDKNQGKNREVRNADRLGKPVMRENPNKNNNIKDNHSSSKKECINEKQNATTTGEKTKSSSNWAEAVQKAMDSIN